MARSSNRDLKSRVLCAAALLLFVLFTCALRADGVVLHLKNGDRIAGAIVSESTNAVVVSNAWASNLSIPVDQIDRRETLAATPPATNAAPAVAKAATPPAAKPTPQPAKKTEVAKATKPKEPKHWKASARMGTDFIWGSADRNIYYGQFSLTYSRPYKSNPKKFFRNTTDYRVDYAKTDGLESANRMAGSNKSDFDLGERIFGYNLVGAGYDEVRKIDLQYEAGPGLGYHVFKMSNFAANLEGGLNYQFQDRRDASDIETIYARAAQDLTWKMYSRVTLSQKSSIQARLDNPDELQLRVEANVAIGLVKNLSLNLTAIDLYDTRPVPGVTPNEFQLRSSIGVSF